MKLLHEPYLKTKEFVRTRNFYTDMNKCDDAKNS